MCMYLSHVGGGHFNRVTSMCCDVSKFAAWSAMRRVRRCIMLKKDQIIHLPTEEEMARTAHRMERRFGLPGFAFGLDGMLTRFEEKPRSIPVLPGSVPESINF